MPRATVIMPAAATGANPHAADDVESRTLRWLTLWLIALANRNAPLRADARLTLRTQRLGPWHGGWLRGSLQLGAGAGFVLAAAGSAVEAARPILDDSGLVSRERGQPCVLAAP